MPSRLDLAGKQFGEWTVIEYVGSSMWRCRCSCGVERDVLGKTLKNGASKSCGHATNQFDDLTGKKFGEYTVLSYKGHYDRVSWWECKCSCGVVKTVPSTYLKSKKWYPNCGHIRSEKLAERNSKGRIQLEGKTFGDWTVNEYVGNKHYRCTCSCGRVKIVASANLLDGTSSSCGHNNGKTLIRDISGQKFGELTVDHYKGKKIWVCRCSCGNVVEVRKGNLLNGSTRSCGCKRYDRVPKETIEGCIDTFTQKYGRAPFVAEVSQMIDRHDAHTRKYIRDYGLQDKINQVFDSIAEAEVFELFGKRNGALLHDRTLISPDEVDIYIPDKNLAIEFNGTYWHSSLYKDDLYHQTKVRKCARRGVHLIHIFEYEWNSPSMKHKIIAYINGLLNGYSTVIAGRNTEIRDIKVSDANDFCDKYHLQNKSNSKINIGCFYNDELVGVMTLGSPRFDHEFQYEMHRMCWKENTTVIGGAEKLFKYATEKYNMQSVLTYVDISKFSGNIYLKLGFDPVDITKPGYFWVDTKSETVLSRYKCQKHLLVEQGLGTEDQTEDEIMSSLYYLKVFNAGNLKMTWYKNKLNGGK